MPVPVPVPVPVRAAVIITWFFGFWEVNVMLVFGFLPVITIVSMLMMALLYGAESAGKETQAQKDAKSAGALVSEVVLGIRTVASFGAEQRFYEDYCKQVDAMLQRGKSSAIKTGLMGGFTMGLMFSLFGFVFWFAFKVAEWRSAGLVASDFFVVTEAGCGQLTTDTFIKSFVPLMVIMLLQQDMAVIGSMAADATAAAKAAVRLFKSIDRESLLDPASTAGEQLPSVRGEIEVRDVVFAYPSAPDRVVCDGYSLTVAAGQMVALCGPSGSGKSTIISLIERFYDPQGGCVMLDGVDIKSLNLRWLRQQIGLVGQEPVLFKGTVAENIRYGKQGSTEAEVEEAARMANAHDFIGKLSDGYQTQVGQGGGKLSGGQKQRVAIARAIVRKPSILLLDEATSALDNESEKIVQAALDEIMAKQKRTTITIAHRLSTIRHADSIAVVNKGKVVEQGAHDELVAKGGEYFTLLEAQK